MASQALELVEQAIVERDQELIAERETNQLLRESIVDLERQLHDPGWVRLVALAEIEFSPEAMRQLRAICRLFAIKNPLIKRGLSLRSAYVWGQGVEIQARANGRRERPGEQDVNDLVQKFLDDPATRREWSGPAARDRLERALGTDGEYYVALFTKPVKGTVSPRIIQADDICDVITNPEDSSEPWFYHRRWYRTTVDPASGAVRRELQEKFYPAVGYRPLARPARFGSIPVGWDSPLLRVRVNEPLGWQHGVPDAYAAIDWANAYKIFLEDWARLVKALSRFAWRLTAKGSQQAQAKRAIARPPTIDRATSDVNGAGATAIMPADAMLEAIPKTGATIDSASGRPLAMMVASALGVPVTMLLADPGQTGARATAETLDQPTELEMGQRQSLHEDEIRQVLQYVIAESVRAPQGALRGAISRDDYGNETVALAGDTEQTIDITWADLDDTDVGVLMTAIKDAASTGVLKPEELLRLILTALGVKNVDELVEAQLDEDGNFIWPDSGPSPGPGQDALDALAAGGDPAQAGIGSMAPDPTDTGPPDDGTQPPADEGAADGDPTANAPAGRRPTRGGRRRGG